MMPGDTPHNRAYFEEFKAPMFKAMTDLVPCEAINGTTPHYGQLLYSIGVCIPAFNVLEIGTAQGWTAGHMAYAVLENNIRFGMKGRFFSIDIDDKSYLQAKHDELGLPSTFIHHPKGSVDYLRKNPWPVEFFDLIFIDGLHQNEYLLEEVKLLYPMLKSKTGYICFHDVYAFVEKAWPKIIERQAPDANGVMRPAFEHIRFQENYGFGMCRKMEGLNHDFRNEYEDQTDFALQQGVINERKEVL